MDLRVNQKSSARVYAREQVKQHLSPETAKCISQTLANVAETAFACLGHMQVSALSGLVGHCSALPCGAHVQGRTSRVHSQTGCVRHAATFTQTRHTQAYT